MSKTTFLPDYLFEVSWEVCNKIGGIHTVLATKAKFLSDDLKDHHIHIGPDIWMETKENPEFVEDAILLRSWRMYAAKNGLRVRVGRWNVPGRPIAILVDFSQFITKKNEIMTDFWNEFKLDSLTGQWDFVEPTLFGYAAGKVIESFLKYNIHRTQKVVAQFHKWMTGAGILYLKQKKLPVATIFTTHATVVGRCLASNNVPLYSELPTISGDDKARWFNVMAMHSLEKCAAVNADVFTAVSSITASECAQIIEKRPDLLTPNGFDCSLVPENLDAVASEGRKCLVELAEKMTSATYDNPFIVGISGRNEMKAKGIDVFIDSLGKLKASGYQGRTVLAFVMTPEANNGPIKEIDGSLYTHAINDPESDCVLKALRNAGINNCPEDHVKAIFIPANLDGNDGIVNKTYYELLAGMDLTVFPSYYEPWGYTPLESIAFGVPTMTTTLTGFGMWVSENYDTGHPSVTVVPRNDGNYSEVVDRVAGRIAELAALEQEETAALRNNAFKVSKIALWNQTIEYYRQAYAMSYQRVTEKNYSYSFIQEDGGDNRMEVSKPNWNSITVTRVLSERLHYLDVISKNLWWCWNQEAIDLFESINPKKWYAVQKNPIALLDLLTLNDYKKLEKDDKFLARLDEVTKLYIEYMDKKKERTDPSIAYFCMEYGLDPSLKIYSGGLGILAGDYLKESSDMNVNMTGIGLLYRYGYFNQKLTAQGEQVSDYVPQDFMKIPATAVRDDEGKWITISVAMPGRNVYARLWRVDVGRTELYLMDTDFDANQPEDRQITYNLYGGDWENRLKQELLLGVGGIRALRALGIKADVYHCNEGHAAFTGIERIREYVNNDNLTFAEALELVRSSSLFTTHTPVPAGHDAFDEDLLRIYMSHVPEKIKTNWTTFMGLGRVHANDHNEKFSMSYLASNISQEINGVSWLHGKVSQDILAPLWPGYLPEELHVGYVTNGVHYPTWAAPEWKAIHSKVFGDAFKTHHYDKNCFEGIYDVDDAEIWKVRKALRKKLVEHVKKLISDPSVSNHYSPQQQVKICDTLRDDVLTIGFARRFATYKRAHLLFRDLDKLNEIVNNPVHPVQFFYAGKAHPADRGGQDLIKRIVEVSKMPQFIGKIVFIPNYDINLAKYLVQGVDIWMNTPTRPLEASGTSGEKAVMNGVMHFSVLDGWWVEGYKENAGWALPQERTYDDQNYQDELDAATIYNMIENDIADKFYSVDKKLGYSKTWIKIIKNTIAKVACDFTTNRMLTDYIDRYYNPLYGRSQKLLTDDFTKARELAFWKKKMRRGWSQIEIMTSNRADDLQYKFELGVTNHAELDVFVGDLDPEDIGIEVVLVTQDAKGKLHIHKHSTYMFEYCREGVAHFTLDITPELTGAYQAAVRIFAKNDYLPHRQDFELVKWL